MPEGGSSQNIRSSKINGLKQLHINKSKLNEKYTSQYENVFYRVRSHQSVSNAFIC